MALFKSKTHQEVWIDHHCGRCHYGQGTTMCPILHRALRSGRKPVEWERNQRKGALMAETMKCHTETRTPPRVGPRVVEDETLTMFDVGDENSGVAMDSDHA